MEKTSRYGIKRYFLLTIVLSFLGWLFETTFVFMRSGRIYDRGFLTSPLCPIYGVTLMATYFLLGTPNAPKGVLSRVNAKGARYVLYFMAAFILPSLAELCIGELFTRSFGVSLWSYEGVPMNIHGYVCLPVSLAWAGLIFLFMNCFFIRLKNFVQKIPEIPSWIVSGIIVLLIAFDLYLNVKALL